MICVFDVIEGPARGKRFWLRENQRIAVGRISTADFAVPADPHMSRHHLIFEASPKILRVRDVGSANGTYVNNSRITKLELCPGDHIRAGSTTFEVTLLGDDQDPHERDGIPLDSLRSGMQSGSASVSASASVVMPDLAAQQVSPSGEPVLESAPSIPIAVSNLAPTLKFPDETQETGGAAVEKLVPPPAARDVRSPIHVSTRVIQYDSSALQPAALAPGSLPPGSSAPGSSAPGSSAPGSSPAGSVAAAARPEVAESAEVTDDQLTMRADPVWWAAYFQISPTPFVLEQRPGLKLEMGEVLKRAQSCSPLALVVNQSQLNAAALNFYSTAINPKLITRLSQTLSLVQCDDSDNLWNFVRLSARQDAMICLAARYSFEASWLVQLLNFLSYPSMLSSLAEAGKSHVTKSLLKNAQFAIYEKNRSGQLGLMID